jgi:hypothetical protein
MGGKQKTSIFMTKEKITEKMTREMAARKAKAKPKGRKGKK